MNWVATTLSNFSTGDWIGIAGIIVGSALSVVLYTLQQRLSDREKIENRLEIERQMNKKLFQIKYEGHDSKIQLYNIKLLGKGRFGKKTNEAFCGAIPIMLPSYMQQTLMGLSS